MDLSAGTNDSRGNSARLPKAVLDRMFLAMFFVGAAMAALAFFIAFVNEGRENPARLAGAAMPIDSSQEAPWGTEGRLVGISGIPTATELVGDGMYLAPGPYLEVRREYEVYSWVETKGYKMLPDGDEEGKLALQMAYEYDKEWSYNPQNSLAFGKPDGHVNPGLHIEKGVYRPDEIGVGLYRVPAKTLVLPAGRDLELTEDSVDLWNDKMQEQLGRLFGNMIYIEKADPDNPQIGDVRVHYEVVSSGEAATVFGKLNGQVVEPFDGNSRGAFRLEWGGVDESVFRGNHQFSVSTWMMRGVSLLLLLFGMLLMCGSGTIRGRMLRMTALVGLAALVFTGAWALAYRLMYSPLVGAVGVVFAWTTAFLIGRQSRGIKQ